MRKNSIRNEKINYTFLLMDETVAMQAKEDEKSSKTFTYLMMPKVCVPAKQSMGRRRSLSGMGISW